MGVRRLRRRATSWKIVVLNGRILPVMLELSRRAATIKHQRQSDHARHWKGCLAEAWLQCVCTVNMYESSARPGISRVYTRSPIRPGSTIRFITIVASESGDYQPLTHNGIEAHGKSRACAHVQCYRA